jgi:hypothetical protein
MDEALGSSLAPQNKKTLKRIIFHLNDENSPTPLVITGIIPVLGRLSEED